MANGFEIKGHRKFLLGVLLIVGWFGAATILCANGKINGAQYVKGHSALGLAIVAICGANAAQKFSKNGGNDE